MILVASYCRVSTDKDDQANSFEAQQRYFKEYIDRQPDWELYRVYADEGIIKYGVERKGTSIIARELWNIVQAELERRNRRGEKSVGHGNRYVFSGKIRCGLCGAAFVARKKRYQNGTVSKKWACFSATTEGTRHLDPAGNSVGCDIGILLRDDFAAEILYTVVSALKADVKAHIGELLAGEVDESFFKSVLDTMTVYPERRIELRLQFLPPKWRFVLDSIADIRRRSGVGCHFNPDVPISVSRPFSSG